MVNDDHTIQLQWDSSKIDAGIKKFKKDLEKVGKGFRMNPFSPQSNPFSPMQKQPRQPRAASISDNVRQKANLGLEDLIGKSQAGIRKLENINTDKAEATLKELKKTLNSLKIAQDKLAKATNRSGKEFGEYERRVILARRQLTKANPQINKITKSFNTQKFAADGLGQSLKNLGRSWVSVFALIGTVGYLKRTAQEMENIGVASLLASGNAKQSAKDLKFVDELTERLGLRYRDTAKAFATFNVGAISGGVDPKEAKEVFVQISQGLAAAGTSAESAKLAFLGFRQMISGSVVQAQEINQIVDQVPAFSGAAVRALEAMGLKGKDMLEENGKSFKDIIKTAGVDAKQFTKIVAKILSDQGVSSGALAEYAQSITAEENRMINSLNKAVEKMSDAGLEKVFKKVFGGLEVVLEAVTPLLVGLSSALGVVADAVGILGKVIDSLGKAFGMSEGEGLQMAIRAVFLLLIGKMVMALGRTTKSLWASNTAAIATIKSYLGIGKAGAKSAKGIQILGNAVKSLMRVMWPLLAAELVINLISDIARNDLEDLKEATKSYGEEQDELNKKLETAQGIYRLWLTSLNKIGGVWDKIVSNIKYAIGTLQEFSKLSWGDVGETIVKETPIQVAGWWDTVLTNPFFDTNFKGWAKGLVGETPLDRAMQPHLLEGQRKADVIMNTPNVTNTYHINGDPDLIKTTIEDSMSSILDSYAQKQYSGGG